MHEIDTQLEVHHITPGFSPEIFEGVVAFTM